MRTVLMLNPKFLLSIILLPVASMSLYGQQTPLDAYVEESLSSNLVLQQRNVSLKKANNALQTAKSLFLPSVDFYTGYTHANGGRNIPLPIGDMINPVYATLNQLTQSNQFPQIDNEIINFLPQHYYEARVRTTMPILNTDIGHNKRIHEQQALLKADEAAIYKRELVKEVKVAYFNYLAALQAVSIHESAVELAKEGQRVNERLLASGAGLPAYVLRAESEVAQAEAQLNSANQDVKNAQLFFNSLLNRPGDSPIDRGFDQEAALLHAIRYLHGATSTGGREELRALATANEVNETVLKMNKQYMVPKINAFLDLGTQAEQFQFNRNSQYFMVGVQLDVPIFNGNRNKQKVQQSYLDLEDTRLQLAQAEQQLELAGAVAQNNLLAAWETYQSSLKQLEAAQTYQRLIQRGFQAGTNTYIETVDARNQLTAAGLAVAVYQFQVLSAAATLERETASYSF